MKSEKPETSRFRLAAMASVSLRVRCRRFNVDYPLLLLLLLLFSFPFQELIYFFLQLPGAFSVRSSLAQYYFGPCFGCLLPGR